jgi:glycosyltransferase involved in cell wall biosynthesis
MRNLKIAILGGGMDVVGGGERVTLEMAKALDADIILANYDGCVLNFWEHTPHIISLKKKLPQRMPFSTIAAIIFFKSLDLRDDYDFFIGNPISMYAFKKHKPNLLYLNTPPRELYDMYYIVIEKQKNWIKKTLTSMWCNLHRALDRHFVKRHVKCIACNSHNVRNRVYKIYQKTATVIYPPIHTDLYSCKSSEGYWLSVNRLHPWKRIELQIEAFRKIPHKDLYIVGETSDKEYAEQLNRIAPKNVKFLGRVHEKTLRDLYSKCEGHITTAIDEDFGLTPLEAMASGKPVVAVKEGGYLETVLDGITGKLVSPDPVEIAKAIEKLSEEKESYREACMKRAKLFDYLFFKKKITTIVKEIYEKYKE